MATPSDDPVYLYQDVFVGLIPERNLNNGEPAGHAMLIACADARRGIRAGARRRARQGRLRAGNAALPQRRCAGGAVLAKGAGLVPGLRLTTGSEIKARRMGASAVLYRGPSGGGRSGATLATCIL